MLNANDTLLSSVSEQAQSPESAYAVLLRNEMGFNDGLHARGGPFDTLMDSTLQDDISLGGSIPSVCSPTTYHSSAPQSIPSAGQQQRHSVLRFMSPPPVTNATDAVFSLSPMSLGAQKFLAAHSRVPSPLRLLINYYYYSFTVAISCNNAFIDTLLTYLYNSNRSDASPCVPTRFSRRPASSRTSI